MTAEGRLRQLQSDFTKVLAETEEYCRRQKIVTQDFPARHARRRKKAIDELSNEEIEKNQTAKYRRETFIYSNDKDTENGSSEGWRTVCSNSRWYRSRSTEAEKQHFKLFIRAS